jgi:hypothetical protein
VCPIIEVEQHDKVLCYDLCIKGDGIPILYFLN